MRTIFMGTMCAVATLIAPPHCDVWSASRPGPGPLYDYIATQAFADGAQNFYLKKIVTNDSRAKLIAPAKKECGGRYESTSVDLIELNHVIETEKRPSGGTVNFTVAYDTDAKVRWLAVETIACSMHAGHAQSVLHAALVSGVETQTVTYRFVNEKQAGKPVVSDLKRTYNIEADEFSDQYRVPYSEE